ncbi:hypothetical protein B0H14DRAFT_2564777 [Mycena olivaceomarginata]|nr:hypothetical protein B0H14DRAFT_2564777 [Mycena olivaceomarginata]
MTRTQIKAVPAWVLASISGMGRCLWTWRTWTRLHPPIPRNIGSPVAAEPTPTTRKRPRATVEEVEDEDERFVEDFPDDLHAAAGNAPWYPFESEDEWELARWLMTSGLSQKKTDAYLKLNAVREGIKPSFQNNRAFLKFVDSLPAGPQWYCNPVELVGDELDADQQPKKEIVEVWYRDPVECGYKPIRVFKSHRAGHYTNREFTEMWTADWWWEIQELLPPGATLAPIIIATEKTQLTRFSGDKQAWPVYLKLGNIRKKTRRSPSARATILIGYIPVTKLEIFSAAKRSSVSHQLFHDCMRIILEPLRVAGKDGVKMDCADGFVRKMFPILSAYIADYPEQCLVARCRENSCPRCLVKPKGRGERIESTMRDPGETLQVIIDQSQNQFPLHNGVFKDHIIKWTTRATLGGNDEIDHRFRAMTPHPTLRHFTKGISLTTQWIGNEHKNMEKVFLGILAKVTDPAVQRAVGGIIDFIHYAHFEVHCDESLAKLDAAWATFHDNKFIFVELQIRKHFNINKLHKLKHYVDSIRTRGTADGFNTENTERLHIDLAKAGYNASNRVNYTRQMTVWLARQEAVYRFGTYLQWALPGYIANSGADSSLDDDEEDEEQTPSAPDPSDADDSDGSDELEDNLSYRVAKTPAFPHVSAATIISEFHATDFLIKLDDFLESHPPSKNPRSVLQCHARHDSRCQRRTPENDGNRKSRAFLLLVYVSSFSYQRILEAIPPHWLSFGLVIQSPSSAKRQKKHAAHVSDTLVVLLHVLPILQPGVLELPKLPGRQLGATNATTDYQTMCRQLLALPALDKSVTELLGKMVFLITV